MLGTIIRQIPIMSAVGGFAGGLYWTLLPDMTVVPMGAPATKDNLQYFKENKGLDDHTLKLIKEVEDRLLTKNVSKENLSSVEYFWCKSPDVIAIGNVNQRKTSFIGLPVNFIYQNIEDVKLSSERGDKESEQLRNCMLLGDSAKKFAMASAYYQLDSYLFFGKLFLLSASVGPYMTLYNMQSLLHLKSKFRQLSIGGSVLIGWAMLFYYSSQLLKSFAMYSSDTQAAQLGDEYLDGGIEYFAKALERNRIIHHLDAKIGATMVDSDGNQIYGLFEIPEPLLTSRLKELMAEKSKQMK